LVRLPVHFLRVKPLESASTAFGVGWMNRCETTMLLCPAIRMIVNASTLDSPRLVSIVWRRESSTKSAGKFRGDIRVNLTPMPSLIWQGAEYPKLEPGPYLVRGVKVKGRSGCVPSVDVLCELSSPPFTKRVRQRILQPRKLTRQGAHRMPTQVFPGMDACERRPARKGSQ
jgi:hypothetical protein